jgi:uncharacterized RDD family membrane protein YckC
MSWGEDLRIETPEQIDFSLEIAGPGARFHGQFIDWVVKWSVVAVVAVVAMAAAQAVGSVSEAAKFLLIALAGAAVFVFFLGYDIYFEGYRNGRTPGKAVAGLRVVRDGGGPIDVRAAAIRNLLGLADFLPFFYLGGGLIAAVNTRGQRLGDMAAGTVVIRERAGEVTDDLEPRILEQAAPEIAFGPQELAKCNAADLNVLLSFFARTEKMDPFAARQLAGKLRDTFAGRIGYQPPTGAPLSPARSLSFLAALYRDLKALHRHS